MYKFIQQIYHIALNSVNERLENIEPENWYRPFRLVGDLLTDDPIVPHWTFRKVRDMAWWSWTNQALETYRYAKAQCLGALHGLRRGQSSWTEKALVNLRGHCDSLIAILMNFSTFDRKFIGKRVAIAHTSLEAAVCSHREEFAAFHVTYAVYTLWTTYMEILKSFPEFNDTNNLELVDCGYECTHWNSINMEMKEDCYVESY